MDEVKSGWSVVMLLSRCEVGYIVSGRQWSLILRNMVPQLTFSTIFVNSTSTAPRLPEPTMHILRMWHTVSSRHGYNVCNKLMERELLENMADLRICHQAIEGVCVGGWVRVCLTQRTLTD